MPVRKRVASDGPRWRWPRKLLLVPMLALVTGCSITASSPVQSVPIIGSPTPVRNLDNGCATETPKPSNDLSASTSTPLQQSASEVDLLSIASQSPDQFATNLSSSWGPTRTLYTLCRPSTTPVINSISDDANRFWETSFLSLDTEPVTAAHSDWATGDKFTWSDLETEENATYIGSVHFWNDVASTITDQDTEGAAVKLELPTSLTRQGFLTAIISAKNTTPKSVFATMVLNAPDPDQTYEVSLIPGSASVHTDLGSYPVDTSALQSKSGALLGCSAPDGILTGRGNCEGYLRFELSVSRPRFSSHLYTLNTLTSSIDAYPGTQVDIVLAVQNPSTDELSGLRLREALPPGLSYVAGSAKTTPYLANGDREQTRTVNFGGSEPTSEFWVTPSEAVPRGGELDLNFTVAVSSTACRGAWEPIRSFTDLDGVSVASILIINVVATC